MDTEEMDGKSLDITRMNIEALKEIFPDVVEEGKIDFDKLRAILGDEIDDSDERYNFTWHGKNQAIRISQTPSMGTLRPCIDKSINWETTKNLYIEGDNLEVLKLLQRSYFGKVDVIYIDPPYNTGHDFVYNDDYSDNISNYLELTGQVDSEGRKISSNTEKDGRFHTNWLNMIYPRLKLARSLLSREGIIFISIDDNEYGNCLKICNEIFGENNYLGTITWIKKTKPVNSGSAKFQLQSNVEYILTFCKGKNAENTYRFNLKIQGERKYPVKTDRGFCRLKDIEDSDFGTKSRDTMKFPILGITPSAGKRWKIGYDEVQRLISEDKVCIVDGKIRVRVYPEDESSDILQPFWSHLSDIGTAEDGKKEFNQLMSQNIGFDTVKPVSLIRELLIHFPSNVLVMDFFSGTSTTADAVMSLNKKDGGSRRFILVQFPELFDPDHSSEIGYSNMCDVGEERIRKRARQLCEHEQTNIDSIRLNKIDAGFRVFRLDSSNIKRWSVDPKNLKTTFLSYDSNLKSDGNRTDSDILFELILKLGLPLTTSIDEIVFDKKHFIYSIGHGALLVFLGEVTDLTVTEEMIKIYRDNQPEIWKVVFKDIGFSSDSVKANVRETLKAAGLKEDSFITL